MNQQASLEAAIATNRFGMGAKPGELRIATKTPREWLLSQLQPPQFSPGLPDIHEAFEILAQHRQQKQARKKAADPKADSDKKQPAAMMQSSLNRIYRDLLPTPWSTACDPIAPSVGDCWISFPTTSASLSPILPCGHWRPCWSGRP